MKRVRYLKHLDADSLDKERFITGYCAHNDAISSDFGDRPDFLDINFEQGGGWERLCHFLDLGVPDCSSPHENAQQYRLR